MIDTHCHIQYMKYDEDRDEVLKRSFDAGMQLICVGTDLEMSKSAVKLAERYPSQIWATVGLHPNDNLTESYDQSEYRKLAQHPQVVAIGEIGLDYFRTPEVEQQATQKQRFLEQISLALELGKPAVIHCREAHKDMFDIVTKNPDLKGVIHSFTGTWSEAQKYIEVGFFIGFNGIITFARDYDETVKNISLENVLLETDAPFLTPIPHRGKRNEPLYVRFVAEKIAEIKNIPLEDVITATTHNARTLFRL